MPDNRGKKRYHNRSRNKKRPQETYVPEGDPVLLSKTVEELGLSEKTLSALKNGKVSTVKDIVSRREFEMFHIQNIGKKNIKEVADKLGVLGLAFRSNDKPQVQQETFDTNKGRQQQNQKNIKQQQPKEEKKPAKRKIISLADRVKKEDKPVYGKDSYIKFTKGGKWGYRDVDGKVLIEPQFDDAFDFKEELAAVEKDGAFGYIDKQGSVVIPFEYETALSFSEGYAVVSKDDKSGYIDKEGRVVIALQYDIASPMQEGKALVRTEGRWGFVTPDGTLTFR